MNDEEGEQDMEEYIEWCKKKAKEEAEEMGLFKKAFGDKYKIKMEEYKEFETDSEEEWGRLSNKERLLRQAANRLFEA